MKELMDMSKL